VRLAEVEDVRDPVRDEAVDVGFGQRIATRLDPFGDPVALERRDRRGCSVMEAAARLRFPLRGVGRCSRGACPRGSWRRTQPGTRSRGCWTARAGRPTRQTDPPSALPLFFKLYLSPLFFLNRRLQLPRSYEVELTVLSPG
jgi:hypothetical protein